MIVGDDFTLVRNPKAASQSLAVALMPYGKKYGEAAHHICVPDREWIIGCVRDPVARMISGWRHYCRARQEVSLGEYMSWDLDPFLAVPFQWVPQARWLEKCNIILRFERLEEDFAKVCKKVGIKARLPHEHKGQSAEISAGEKDLIRHRFKEDYARFYNAD